jgi:hypothetical protein
MAAINETHAAPMRRFLNAIFLPALVGTRFEYMRAAPKDDSFPGKLSGHAAPPAPLLGSVEMIAAKHSDRSSVQANARSPWRHAPPPRAQQLHFQFERRDFLRALVSWGAGWV